MAASLINGFCTWQGIREDDIQLVRQFAGYSLVVVFLLQIVIGLFSDFWLMAQLLQFYTIYIVWEGSSRLMEVPEQHRLRFTILASVALIASPALIGWIFDKLTIVLN